MDSKRDIVLLHIDRRRSVTEAKGAWSEAFAHRSYIVLLLLAFLFLVSGCESPEAFRGTVVAPLETISALTPGPEILAELATKMPITTPTRVSGSLAAPRPATPTPHPATPTPGLGAPIPRPPTPTPGPVTPEVSVPTVNPDNYIGMPQEVGRLGDVWTLSDLRVGVHRDRIRVVWEMAERRDTLPLTRIVEVDNTRTPFPIRGALLDASWGLARIDVMISDCSAMGMPFQEMLPMTLPDSALVTKVGLHPTFDDALLGFSIGLARPAPYKVYTLTDPVRLVIDVITAP